MSAVKTGWWIRVNVGSCEAQSIVFALVGDKTHDAGHKTTWRTWHQGDDPEFDVALLIDGVSAQHLDQLYLNVWTGEEGKSADIDVMWAATGSIQHMSFDNEEYHDLTAGPPNPPPTAEDAALFISQTCPSTMITGTQQPVTVTMSNAGTAVWTAAAGYRLGSQNPQDNTTFGLNRVELPNDVNPGASVTFGATITAPARSGHVDMQWQMVREFVHWFGQATDLATIVVGYNPDCVGLAAARAAAEGSIADAEAELASLDPSDSGFHMQVARLNAAIKALRQKVTSIDQEMIAKGC